MRAINSGNLMKIDSGVVVEEINVLRTPTPLSSINKINRGHSKPIKRPLNGERASKDNVIVACTADHHRQMEKTIENGGGEENAGGNSRRQKERSQHRL